jgi:hypothetical protein
MSRADSKWAVAILAAAPIAMLCAGWFFPAIAQDPTYHDFADQRTMFGIPNFWNVVSNAVFLIVGAAGVRTLAVIRDRWDRNAFITLLAGTVLVALGSAYYHLSPDSTTLFWDRLPMTIVFMSIFATVLADRIEVPIERSLIPLLLIGAALVLDWKFTGDLRLYAIVQFYPMLAIPILLIFRRSRNGGGLWIVAMTACYAAAKVLESLDDKLGGFVSTGGHPWKHVVSAIALLCYIVSIERSRGESRRPPQYLCSTYPCIPPSV